MRTVKIDYEGNQLTETARDEATHVVVSRKRDGDMRVQPTSDPLQAFVQAQRDGDEGPRVTSIDDGRATFTTIPDYDPSDSPLSRAARRNRLIETLVVMILVVVVVAAFFLAQ